MLNIHYQKNTYQTSIVLMKVKKMHQEILPEDKDNRVAQNNKDFDFVVREMFEKKHGKNQSLKRVLQKEQK